MNKAQRIVKPLHWSLEHYPFYPVWGQAVPRQETRLECYQGNVAAAHWYTARMIAAKRAKDNRAAGGYLQLARQRYVAAEQAAGRCF